MTIVDGVVPSSDFTTWHYLKLKSLNKEHENGRYYKRQRKETSYHRAAII